MAESIVPESRVYRHQGCQGETVVGGQSFEALSDPLSDMSRTWCSTCNNFFPLAEFAWADTDEMIPDYYARHGAKATKLERFLCSRLVLVASLLTGLIGGIVLAIIFFRNQGIGTLLLMGFTLGVVGVIVCGSLKEFFIGKLIVRRVTGVSDTRLLK